MTCECGREMVPVPYHDVLTGAPQTRWVCPGCGTRKWEDGK